MASRMPRRCDALPSTNPVETMAETAGYDLTKSGGWILSTSPHLTGSEVLCWILEGVSPSAAPSDVEVVVGPECKSGNVAGHCRRTLLGYELGGCEQAISSGVGSVVWWPVVEEQY
jgi:hypothetical protein